MLKSIHSLGLCALVATIAGCSGSAVDRARYVNQRPVTAVNDRVLGPKPDKETPAQMLYHYDALLHRRLTRATELRTTGRARNVR